MNTRCIRLKKDEKIAALKKAITKITPIYHYLGMCWALQYSIVELFPEKVKTQGFDSGYLFVRLQDFRILKKDKVEKYALVNDPLWYETDKKGRQLRVKHLKEAIKRLKAK